MPEDSAQLSTSGTPPTNKPTLRKKEQSQFFLVDSHCHLDRLDLEEGDNLAHALARAQEQGVAYFLCVSIDLKTFQEVRSIAETFSNVFASVGVHPNEEGAEFANFDELVCLGQHPKIIAVGETGLDYYRTAAEGQIAQQDQFRIHIAAAKTLKKPLIIHSREVSQDTIALLQQEQAQQVGGVMHCFTETQEVARQALDLGFYISFSGIITFKNARDLQKVVRYVPLEHMLIETDSPYLAPTPYRGKPNEPAYVRLVAEKIAELKQISYEAVAKQTTKNFFNLFKIKE